LAVELAQHDVVNDTNSLRAADQRAIRAGLFLALCVLSAPPAQTPFHIDRDDNFWLQIRGSKRKTVWSPDARTNGCGATVRRTGCKARVLP